MSIHKIKGKFAFSCDECSETLDARTASFQEAVVALVEKGWTSSLWEGQYIHHCPDCAKKMGTS